MIKKILKNKPISNCLIVILTVVMAIGITIPILTTQPQAEAAPGDKTFNVRQDSLRKQYTANLGYLYPFTVTMANGNKKKVEYNNVVTNADISGEPTAFYLGEPVSIGTNGMFSQSGLKTELLYGGKKKDQLMESVLGAFPVGVTGYTMAQIRAMYKSEFFPTGSDTGTYGGTGLWAAINNMTATEAHIAGQATIWYYAQGWEFSSATVDDTSAPTLNNAYIKVLYDSTIDFIDRKLTGSSSKPYLQLTVTASAPKLISSEGNGAPYYYGPFNVEERLNYDTPTSASNLGNIFLEFNSTNTALSFARLSSGSFTELGRTDKYDSGVENVQYTTNKTDVYIKINDSNPHALLDGLEIIASGAIRQSTYVRSEVDAIFLTRAGSPDLVSISCSCAQDIYGVTTISLANICFDGQKTANSDFEKTDFTFSVYEITQKEFSDANGSFGKSNKVSAGRLTTAGTASDIWFTPIMYTPSSITSGNLITKYYAIVEDSVPAGWKENNQTIYRSVTITKNTTTGKLTAVINESTKSFVFENETEKPNPANVLIKAKKTTTGTGIPASWSFDFKMYESTSAGAKGNLIADGSKTANNSNPSVGFNLPTFTIAGDYYFLLEEEAPTSVEWTAEGKQYLIYVNVSASMIATVKYCERIGTESWSAYKDYTAGFELVLKNTYKKVPDPVNVSIKAKKTTTGTGIPTPWSFEFKMFSSDTNATEGTVIAGGTKTVNNTTPNVTFDLPTFTVAGDYYFLLKETAPTATGWTADEKQYHVYVNVSSEMVATVKYRERTGAGSWSAYKDYTTGLTLVFNNTYEKEPEPVRAKFYVRKAIDGTDIPNTWSFNIGLYNATFNESTGTFNKGGIIETKTVTNTNVSTLFETGPYTESGVHYYLISEETPGSVWQQNREYLVKVTVTGTTDLTTSIGYKYRVRNNANTDWANSWTPSANNQWSTYTSSWTGTNTQLVVTNKYQPLKVTFKAIKNTKGADMKANQFSFALYEIDVNDEIDDNSNVVIKNSVAGNTSPVVFTLPTYTKAGTYLYYLKEIGNELGWDMDTTSYRLEVRVFENSSGKLDSEIRYIIADDDGNAISGASYVTYNGENVEMCPKFINIYSGPEFPFVGGVGKHPFVMTAIFLIFVFATGTLLYRTRKRRRYLDGTDNK